MLVKTNPPSVKAGYGPGGTANWSATFLNIAGLMLSSPTAFSGSKFRSFW